MGLIAAAVVFCLAVWWFTRTKRTAITWLGMTVFALGLIPLATITSFHPYMLLAIGQSILTFPLVPIGVAIMALAHYLENADSENEKG